MEEVSLGIYISVPFCRTKCSYCNFASDVFSRAVFDRYVDRVCSDIAQAAQISREMGGRIEHEVDSIYLGGGTPTVLEGAQLERIFQAVTREFQVHPQAEVTVECAPGSLTGEMIEALPRCGVSRVSLGVQSFVDGEAASVGRLHKRSTVLDDIRRLRTAGISNINVDLIAGLPHQTASSWEQSLTETLETGAPHVSIYMLEVDEDSRLGRELIAGGTRYHAHFVPEEEVVADFYLAAGERLNGAGVSQYEISNFSRARFESRHNLKYWTRQPYLGFGVDAHSMLHTRSGEGEEVRFATPDSLTRYLAGNALEKTVVSRAMAFEEIFFLGLRLNRGLDFEDIVRACRADESARLETIVSELVSEQLLERDHAHIRLTTRGRLLSNEVFQRFLSPATVSKH